MASQIRKGAETNKITIEIMSLVNYESYITDATVGFVIEPLHYRMVFKPVDLLVRISASALYEKGKHRELQCNTEFDAILNEVDVENYCDYPVLVFLHRLEVDMVSQDTIFHEKSMDCELTHKKTFIGCGNIDLIDLCLGKCEVLQGKICFHQEIIDATDEIAFSSYKIYANLDLYKKFFSEVGNILTINVEYISGLQLERDNGAKIGVRFKLAHPEYFTDSQEIKIEFWEGEFINQNYYSSAKRWDCYPFIKGKGLQYFNEQSNWNNYLLYNQTNHDEVNTKDNDRIVILNTVKRKLLKYSQCSDLEKYFCTVERHIIVEVKSNSEASDGDDNMQQFWRGKIDLSALLYPSVEGGRFKTSLLKCDPNNKNKMSASIGYQKDLRNFESTTVMGGSENMSSSDKNSSKSGSGKANIKHLACIELIVSFTIPLTDRRSFFPSKNRSEPRTKNEYVYDQRKSIRVNNEFEDLLVLVIEQIKEFSISNTKTRATINIPSCIDYLTTLDGFKSNLSEIFLKQICLSSGNKPKRHDNAQFKKLISLVFNEAVEKMRKIINAQLSDYNFTMNEKFENDYNEKHFKIFVSNECREMRFDHILRYDCQSEEELIDMIIYELNGHNFYQANVYLQEMLDMGLKDGIGLVFSTYLLYIYEGFEAVKERLIQLSLERTENILIWILIYFVYKSNNYQAGISHAKAMSDSLKDSHTLTGHFWKRKELYFVVKDSFRLELNSLYVFLKTGMYKFAEFAYEHCSHEMDKATQIEIFSAILIHQRRYAECLDFISSQVVEGNTASLKSLIEAHCMFHLEQEEYAIRNYKEVCISKELSSEIKHIAYLRCGFWEIGQKNFENAIVHFDMCCKNSKTFLGWLGLGICYFRMRNFERSQECFSKGCHYWSYSYVTWCYLAMINIKLNQIEMANTCTNILKKLQSTQDNELWEEVLMTYKIHNVKIPC